MFVLRIVTCLSCFIKKLIKKFHVIIFVEDIVIKSFESMVIMASLLRSDFANT